MNIYDFIDNMIVRLDGVTVKGAGNCAIIVETINDLNTLRKIIEVKEPEKEADHGEPENKSAENV